MRPVSTLAATVDQIWYDMAWYGHSMNITTWKRHLRSVIEVAFGFGIFLCKDGSFMIHVALPSAVFGAALTMRQVPRRFPGHFMPHRRLTYAAGWNDPKSRFIDLNGSEFDLNSAWTLDSLAFSLDSGFGHRLFPGTFRHSDLRLGDRLCNHWNLQGWCKKAEVQLIWTSSESSSENSWILLLH